MAAAQRGSPAAHQQWTQGIALARQGRLAEALACLQRATQMSPSVPLYWMNLASVQRKLFRPAEAIASAGRAFELDRRDELACNQFVELLRSNNRGAEALRALDELDPKTERSPLHWMLRGSLLMGAQQWQGAAMAFLQVLQVEPADIEAYMQLGFALSSLKRFGEAAECFRTVTILEPGHFGAAVYAAHYAAWACDWAQGGGDLERLDRSFSMQGDGSKSPAFSPFCVLSMNDDPRMHRVCAEIEAARQERDALAAAGRPAFDDWPQARQSLDGGRIRIGFVSADFRTHATSMLLVRTLERLPRERFELFLYSHGEDDRSPLRQRMRQAVDHFVETGAMNTVDQAQRIRDDGVTVLVDMSGYTSNTRIGMFALRPAPVQVVWLAYPSTLGARFVDYIVGDPVLTPIEHAGHFTEKIAQLPVCYEPTDELRDHPERSTRAASALPDDAFVFACFNQSYKITEPVFERWCRILHRVPGSVLWLLVPQEDIQAALRQHAVDRGIAAERLIFAPFVSPTDHLARLPLADLFLDTFPYGAHTTCSDALWMGLPVLTRIGRSFSARVAASLLAAVELPGFVVDNDDDYEERAVALATVPGELAAARAQLDDRRLELPLFDNERFTAELAALWERMVGRWERGLAPELLPAATDDAA